MNDFVSFLISLRGGRNFFGKFKGLGDKILVSDLDTMCETFLNFFKKIDALNDVLNLL